MWEVGSRCPTAGARSAAWQEAKLALFYSQFLLFLNKNVENPTSSRAARNTARVTAKRGFLFLMSFGKEKGSAGTPEQPFAVQLSREPSCRSAGEVSSSTSRCQNITPHRGVAPGPGIHLPGGDCGRMPGFRGAVGGEDHAVIKSSLKRKGGCKLHSFIWVL